MDPVTKTTIELLSGKALYPSVFDSQGIKQSDYVERLVNNMTGLGDIYRDVAGATWRPGATGRANSLSPSSLANHTGGTILRFVGIRSVDPQAQRVWALRDNIDQFLESDREVRPATVDMLRAASAGNTEAFKKAAMEYKRQGGTKADYWKSLQ